MLKTYVSYVHEVPGLFSLKIQVKHTKLRSQQPKTTSWGSLSLLGEGRAGIGKVRIV